MAKQMTVSRRVWLRLKQRDRLLQSIERRIEDARRAEERRSPTIDGAVARVLDDLRAAREREQIIREQVERLEIVPATTFVQDAVDALIKKFEELRTSERVHLTAAQAVSRVADQLPYDMPPFEASPLLRGRGDYGRREPPVDEILQVLSDAQKRITISAEYIEKRTKALEAESEAGDLATIALARFVTNRHGGG